MNFDRGGATVVPRSEEYAAEGVSADAARAAAAAKQAEPLTHRERRVIVTSMMLPVFIGSVDQSILASSLPTIGRALGNVHDLPWLVTGFLIAATALTPLYGKFADIHGRRVTLLIALGVYMTGSLISASSTSMLMLICGRIVQGCGSGGLVTSAQMVLGDIAAPKDRAKYYVYFSAAFTTAGGVGPALGGWICDHLYWWVIFLWNVPLCLIALALSLTVLRRLPRYDRPHRLDVVGALLIMAASSAFMLALNLGGVRYPWFSLPVLALAACAVLLGAAFVVRLLTAVEPLIPISILSDPAARLAILANCFGWGSIVGLNIFLPMYLQTVLGWSATDSGLSLIILMVTLNASAGLSSQIIGRVKRYKALPMACMVLAIGSVIALALSVSAMTPLKFQIILFLIGIGFGPTAPLTQVALQNTVAARHLGTAVGAMNFGRTLMGTVLVAVFATIVLAGVPAHGLVSDGARVLSATPASTFAVVFFAMAGTMSIALLSVIRLEEKPLLETMPGARG